MKNRIANLLLLLAFALPAAAQVPVLNSYPSAAPTIFLDFDGQTVSGTQWNNVAGTIAAGPSNLTPAQVTEVYNRIAEDYRPFNINVTTDSTKYFAAPAKQRIRLIFTITSSWYAQPVGGVSYIGSFAWGDNTPAWIFTEALGYNIKQISEAGAHEAGHTFGLRHQASYDGNCTKLTDYNAGTGSGEIGWAPIMGVGYYQNFTTWNLGPTSLGCTTSQSDLLMIARAANGVTFRTDDFAETFPGASPATFSNARFTIDGVISQSDDKDMFRFTVTQAGRFVLTAVPYNVGAQNRGSDLDMLVTLYNSAQTQMGSYNPAPILSSVVDTTLEAGTYYLQVDGKGNQFATEYGSLGSYALQGDFTAFGVLPLHKLELRGVNENGMHRFGWEIVADETVTQQVLEVSTNGTSFAPVADLAAAGRDYRYFPNASSSLQYRLHVTFDNGRNYYSNVVVLRPATGNAPKPELVSTLVRTGSVMVTSPAGYKYTVADISGRTISSGALADGTTTIALPGVSAGAYAIRFTNGVDQFVEKFLCQ
ncbi:MAG: hypothetical protein JWP27_2097 [Flaviaesturariibacter sp.]|nr:hypothetical protein [Flaviaesturariibacter sp.]